MVSAVAETGKRTTTLSHLSIASLWFAFFAQWMSVVPLIVPDQISGILGPGAVGREGITGTVVAAGALVSLVVTPVAGAISDRWRSRSGRRRPFLIIGMLGSCIGLLAFVTPMENRVGRVVSGIALLVVIALIAFGARVRWTP